MDTQEGYVKLCFNGSFGTVCNDGWGENETMVVCEQLEFPFVGKTDEVVRL